MEEEKAVSTADQVAVAFKKVTRALEGLTPEAQQRVVRSVSVLLDVKWVG